MTISAVPFALQNVPINADVVRQAVSSLIPDGGGVIEDGDFNTTQTGTPSMGVVVAVGRAWIDGTNVAHLSGQGYGKQGMYFVLNDAAYTVTLATSDATNPRIDVVYAAVNDAAYSGSTNNAVIAVATGTPAATPAAPSIPSNAIALANVAVAANATSITNANITTLTDYGFKRDPIVSSAVALSGWSEQGTITGTPLGSSGHVHWSGYFQMTRTGSNLPISTSGYTDIGYAIPAVMRCTVGTVEYVRGIISGNGLYQPCTVFFNFQTGDVQVRADSAVTMISASFVACHVDFLQQ